MESSYMSYAPVSSLKPIIVIGLNCDDPAALNRVLREERPLLMASDIICGGKQILQVLSSDPELAGKLLPLTPPLEPLFECLSDLRKNGMRVVALSEGDPLFFGFGASLARRLGSNAIKIRPAVSALQAACARLSLPWHNIFCLSLHGHGNPIELYSAIASNQPICVLMSPVCGPDLLARTLLDLGANWYDINIFERMGSESEKLHRLTLEECSELTFDPCSTAILVPNNTRKYAALGMTRSRLVGNAKFNMPVRSAILAMLHIFPYNTVWNIGAYWGFLAIEAATAAHCGQVITIEKDWKKALDIQRNRKLIGAVNLTVCLGEAPGCLKDLPKPDRIFIGIRIETEKHIKLIDYCVDSLEEGGRIVFACSDLNSLNICRSYVDSLRWMREMQQIHAEVLESFGKIQKPESIKPVFLLAVQKPRTLKNQKHL